MGDLTRFLSRLERAKARVEKSGLRDVIIIHHDEADGLTGAALAKLAFNRLGVKAQLICLDKLYPEVVAEVQARTRNILVYVDLGSGHIDWLSLQNTAENLILVIDHHDTQESPDPLVLNLNPELESFSGEKDASSATIAYLFSKEADPTLLEYAHLALVGSLEIPGDLQGPNTIPVKDAEDRRLVKKTATTDYKIVVKGMALTRSRAAAVLNVLGSVGYYRNGPQRGVDACIDGFDEQLLVKARELEAERKGANRRMLEKIRANGLSQMNMVQWFHAQDNYAGMSGKVVGSFCSYLRFQRNVIPVKYLIGMMNIPPEIPGWGMLPSSMVKVSARAPSRWSP